MGQDKKTNPGRFINKMIWMEPVNTRSPTGGINRKWELKEHFFSEITSDENSEEKTEHEIIRKQNITFVTWKCAVTTGWKISYNEKQYNVTSLKILENGRYAEYKATREITEDEITNN